MKKINRILLIFIFILFILSSTETINISNNQAKSALSNKMYERDYVQKYCTGTIEYVLPDKTRVDCLTDEYAIEFDYAKKWAESIGQSLYYSKKTGKKPAVAIITSRPEDKKYIERIKEVDKNITVFEIPAGEYSQKASLN